MGEPRRTVSFDPDPALAGDAANRPEGATCLDLLQDAWKECIRRDAQACKTGDKKHYACAG
jgi:hypothetical protein